MYIHKYQSDDDGGIEMEKYKFNFGNFLKGILFGSIIAGVVVLFTAPHSGMETRRMIQDKGIQLRDRSMKTLEDARKTLDDTRERIETIISDVLHSTEQETQLEASHMQEQMDVLSHQS